MRKQLIFTSTNPDDDSQIRDALDAWRWRQVVTELAESLRRKVKYQTEFKSAEDEIEAIRTDLFNCLSEYGLSLDE